MKKFIKGSFVTIGILMLLGIILSGIGLIFGGGKAYNWVNTNANFSFNFFSKLPFITHNYDNIFLKEDYDFIIKGKNQEITLSEADEIANLEIELGFASLMIENSKDDNYYLKSNTVNEYGYYLEEGTLHIEGLKEESQFFGALYHKNEITLQIPKEKTLEKIQISIGGGEMEIDELQGKNISFDSGVSTSKISEIKGEEINIEVGAGELVIQKLETDNLNFTSGVGEMRILEGNIKDGNLETGIGDYYYEGNVEESLYIQAGVGIVELILEGEEEAFNLDISGGIGNLSINDYSYTGIGNSKVSTGTSDKMIQIDRGIGDVSIDFK